MILNKKIGKKMILNDRIVKTDFELEDWKE